MTREDMLTRLMEHEPTASECEALVGYADLLGELERMLSEREMQTLVEMGSRMLRATRPELFRAVRLDSLYPPGARGRAAANAPRA